MIVGTKANMDQARLYRKRLGGGMRQAGVLAAAGLIALEEHPAKLAADHANARFLAAELAALPGISVDPSRVQTNIVIFDIAGTGLTPPDFSARLKQRDVLMNGVGPTRVRAVTHYDVDRAACEQALDAIREVVGAAATAKA
jgi:threonine aldolase